MVNSADPANMNKLLGEIIEMLYKAHTAEFIEMYEINAYCGLSCYIPHSSRNDLNSYYKQLSWYQAGGYNRLF
jgi:hypothetical protein